MTERLRLADGPMSLWIISIGVKTSLTTNVEPLRKYKGTSRACLCMGQGMNRESVVSAPTPLQYDIILLRTVERGA